jgi:diadenosine tetraphosphate (Ap4A) HIT family hydrolase
MTDPVAWHLDARLSDDTHPVDHWPLCEVRLMDDANHPWLILVPRVAGATELLDLSDPDRQRLMDEIARASRALRDAYAPDKLNVAALGNVVPQLHVHVIARFRDDIAWPKPVWGQADARPYPPEALADRVRVLREAFDA